MKRVRVHSIIGTVLMLGWFSSVHALPVMWVGNGHYYEFVASPGTTWDAASTAAQGTTYLGVSGHLATISSQAENDFVFSLLGNAMEAWLGGFQNPLSESLSTAGWTWVNSEGVIPGDNAGPIFANWNSDPGYYGGIIEPNDNAGPGSEQYLTMFGGLADLPGSIWYGSATEPWASFWNDEGNLGLITGYVVEHDSAKVPDPGSTLVLLALGLSPLARGRRSMN